MKKVRIESDNGKKTRSNPTLEDDSEKQLEMRLLESTTPETEIKQPKKEVRRRRRICMKLFFCLHRKNRSNRWVGDFLM